ncbi:MAG: glycogenin glucosyltransferase [Pycnora praestabilis]|nr:MAG: glycogenin glucosyltransferase [Pycnora praestabilis]
MAAEGEDVFCTLLMTDAYLPGAAVLAQSLRDAGTKRKLVVLVTPDSLQASTLSELKNLYDEVIPVDRITNKAPANLYLMDRPDLLSTFTKIALWRLVQYRRIIYIDADVVALRRVDELFDLETTFAASPDIGWPDCFNSGVMVLNPNMGDYYALLALAERGISFDGADQGLLNMHFREWQRLSFTYNCTPSGHYQYVPAYRHFQSNISMVHYIGLNKPWQQGREITSGSSAYEEMLGRWWAVYDRHYRAPSSASISGQTKQQLRTVQQYVTREASSADYGYSSTGLGPSNGDGMSGTTEEPLSDKTGLSMITSTQRRFSAPQMEWDPAHDAPPANSRPEASNFPRQTYTMSSSGELFRAPSSYPEAPKNLWYEIPRAASATEQQRLIFPWESNASKPTRVFAEDKAASEETTSVSSPGATDDDDTIADKMSPPTPTIQATSPDPWQKYTRTNAWDDMPEIERYLAGVAQSRKGKVQVVQSATGSGDDLASPSGEGGPPRRPSMKLTDFPTEIERPSLPVTPAPVRRPSFWGEERDAAGELPAAEGVPRQEDWNPLAKLEELSRRQSEVPLNILDREIPNRKLPESAAPMPNPETEASGLVSGGASPHGLPLRPAFEEPDYRLEQLDAKGEDPIPGEGMTSPTAA